MTVMQVNTHMQHTYEYIPMFNTCMHTHTQYMHAYTCTHVYVHTHMHICMSLLDLFTNMSHLGRRKRK